MPYVGTVQQFMRGIPHASNQTGRNSLWTRSAKQCLLGSLRCLSSTLQRLAPVRFVLRTLRTNDPVPWPAITTKIDEQKTRFHVMLRAMMQNGKTVGILIVSWLPIGHWRNTQTTLTSLNTQSIFYSKLKLLSIYRRS